MSQERSLQEILSEISHKLEENKAFLQNYMLDPNPDNRPAEEERIKEVLSLADDMETILTQLIENKDVDGDKELDIATLDQDFDLKYKTHVLGLPDGGDTIEGDWTLGEEDMVPMPADDQKVMAHLKCNKKAGKKEKKEKKQKKHKKGKKNKK